MESRDRGDPDRQFQFRATMNPALHRPPRNPVHRPLLTSQALQRHSTCLAAAELVLGTARVVGTVQERANEAFVSAVRLYKDCHWEFAFERFAVLADRGHAPAAKLVLLMLRYGSSVYGTSFSAKPEQVARWAQRVLRSYTFGPQEMAPINANEPLRTDTGKWK